MHIVSYAPPFRLRTFHQNIFLHEVEVASYPLFKYPPYELGLVTKLVELAETRGLDIIHAHYAVPHAASAYLAKQILNSRRLKTVTTLHGTDITLVGADPSFHRVVKFAIEKSDGVTAVSRYLKTADDRGIRHPARDPGHPQFRRARPAGPEPRRLCSRDAFAPDGEKILMHASNFRPVKRIGDVVRIFARVRERIPAKLLLIGDGPERLFIQQLVRELKLASDVHFLGEQDQLEPLFFCADLFLLPSEQESFGLTALEAMNCGVPVDRHRCRRTARGHHPRRDGISLPRRRHRGHGGERRRPSRAIRPGMRSSEAQARKRAEQHFDADDIIPQYEAFYEEIC